MVIKAIIDLDNGELLEATGKHRISALDIQGSETATLNLTFYKDGKAVTDSSVLTGASIDFGVKADADYTGASYLVYHNTFSASSDGLTFTGTPTWATAEVETALGNESSVKLHSQVKVVISGITYYSQVFEVEIHNNVIQAAGSTSSVIFPRLITTTSDPTANDDSLDGYGVSSIWLNTSNNYVYVLMNNTAGAAVWKTFISSTLTAALDANNNKITNLTDGTASSDAATKGQLDALVNGAPDNLNTLDEIAAALNDDNSIAATLTNNIATKLPLAGGTLTGDVLFNDGVKAKFGTHSDLTIQHDGNSYISENGTGDFYITTNDASIFLQDAGSGRVMLAAKGGSGEKIELNHSGSKKFETLSTGVKAYGLLETDSGGADSPSLKVAYNATNYLEFAHDRLNGVSSGSNRLIFQTGGTEAARFDHLGRLGIGVTSLSYILDVAHEQGGVLARFKDSDSSHDGIIVAGDTNAGWLGNSASNAGEGIYYQNSLNAMRIYTNGTEAARFDSSGRLGIGYTSMIKELMVNGSILIANNNGFLQYDGQGNVATLLNLTTANTLDIGQSTHVDDIHFNIEGTADAMLLNSTGLGIGGTPQSKLHVVGGDIRIDNNQGYLAETAGGGVITAAKMDGSDNLLIADGNFVIDVTGSSELMRLNSTGLGIGGTADRKLHVNSGTENANTIFESTDTAVTVRFKDSTGESELECRNDWRFSNNAGANEQMRIASSGNVGIANTNPSDALTIGNASNTKKASIKIDSTSFSDASVSFSHNGTYGFTIGTDESDGKKFKISSGDTLGTNDRLVIDGSTGNVGIGGVSAPSCSLDIYNGSGWAELHLDGSNGGELKLQKAGTTHLDLYASDSGSTGSVIKAQSNLQLSSNNSTDANRSIYLNSSGNVGIGTTSPSMLIDCQRSGNGNVAQFGDGTRAHRFYVDSANAILAIDGSVPYQIWTGGAERMRIASDGDITQNYINYTDGSNYEALKISAESDHIKYDTTSIGSFASNTREHRFNVNNSTKFRVSSSGVLNYGHYYIVGNYELNNSWNDLILTTSTQTDNDIIFKPNNSETARITSDYFRFRDSSGKAVQIQASVGNEARILANNQDHGTALNLVLSSEQLKIKTDQGAVHSATFDETGDLELLTDGKGLILSSPDGTRYKITCANGGAVTSTAM